MMLATMFGGRAVARDISGFHAPGFAKWCQGPLQEESQSTLRDALQRNCGTSLALVVNGGRKACRWFVSDLFGDPVEKSDARSVAVKLRPAITHYFNEVLRVDGVHVPIQQCVESIEGLIGIIAGCRLSEEVEWVLKQHEEGRVACMFLFIDAGERVRGAGQLKNEQDIERLMRELKESGRAPVVTIENKRSFEEYRFKLTSGLLPAISFLTDGVV